MITYEIDHEVKKHCLKLHIVDEGFRAGTTL